MANQPAQPNINIAPDTLLDLVEAPISVTIAERSHHNLQQDKLEDETKVRNQLQKIEESFSREKKGEYTFECRCGKYYPSRATQFACEGNNCTPRCIVPPTTQSDNMLVANWIATVAGYHSVGRFWDEIHRDAARSSLLDVLQNYLYNYPRGSTLEGEKIVEKNGELEKSTKFYYTQQIGEHTLEFTLAIINDDRASLLYIGEED